jgi:hypothetical protein
MMDADLLTESKVFAAYRVLFAGVARVNISMLQAVELPEIKRAYRRRALDTHPDRFAACDENYRKVCTDRFIEASDAYETLNTYLALRDRGFEFEQVDAGGCEPFRDKRPSESQSSQSGSDFGDRNEDPFPFAFWERDMPRRYLRLGEFLYYSGVISWMRLIKALVWQKTQRPRIGEIAQRWRWLTESQIIWVLKDRRPGERLGEILLRRRMISPFQLNVLIWQQRKIQKPIGVYFVHQGLLTQKEILHYLQRQHIHNLDCCSEDTLHRQFRAKAHR